MARLPASLAIAALVVLVSACSKPPAKEQFVGKWKSSRIATTPLVLHPNGEWEIRGDDERVLQFGVWQLRDRTLVWSIRQGADLMHDPNPVVSVAKDRFELRERDGSITRFDRIP